MDYRIFPPSEIEDTPAVELPYSKSMAIRTMILGYIADGSIDKELKNICGDTLVTGNALAAMRDNGTEINVGSCGAAMRFITAIAAATPGCCCTIDGDERLRKRPLAPLVNALRTLGASIEYTGEEGHVPVKITGSRLAGGEVELDASQSSQFASALLMAAPLMSNGIEIKFKGEPRSLPYLRMTAGILAQWGVDAEADRTGARAAGTLRKSASFCCERDWSAAAFWFEIVALTGTWATLAGMTDKSLQADRQEAGLFERLGALLDFEDGNAELSASPDLYNFLEADMSDMPDAVPALAVTAAMAGIPFKLTGVSSLRTKECDRIQALTDELLKVGIVTDTEDYGDSFVWDGTRRPIHELPVFDSHNDHRIAMALAPVSVFIPGCVVTGTECVDKSYPEYWQHLTAAGFTLCNPDEAVEGFGE